MRSYPRKFGEAVAKLLSASGLPMPSRTWGRDVPDPAGVHRFLTGPGTLGEDVWPDAQLEAVAHYLGRSKYLRVPPAHDALPSAGE